MTVLFLNRGPTNYTHIYGYFWGPDLIFRFKNLSQLEQWMHFINDFLIEDSPKETQLGRQKSIKGQYILARNLVYLALATKVVVQTCRLVLNTLCTILLENGKSNSRILEEYRRKTCYWGKSVNLTRLTKDTIFHTEKSYLLRNTNKC